MVRSSKVEACMICGELPCACFTSAKKVTPRKRAVKAISADSSLRSQESDATRSEAPSIRTQNQFAAMRSAAALPRRTQSTAPAPLLSPLSSEENAALDAALIAFGPLLHPDEKRKYPHLFGGVAARALEWRNKHVK